MSIDWNAVGAIASVVSAVVGLVQLFKHSDEPWARKRLPVPFAGIQSISRVVAALLAAVIAAAAIWFTITRPIDVSNEMAEFLTDATEQGLANSNTWIGGIQLRIPEKHMPESDVWKKKVEDEINESYKWNGERITSVDEFVFLSRNGNRFDRMRLEGRKERVSYSPTFGYENDPGDPFTRTINTSFSTRESREFEVALIARLRGK